MSEPEGDRAMAISRFSLLLSTLKVPGPCDLLLGESSLGSGAQFDVYKKEINGLTRSKIAVAALNNSVDIAAIKIPKFILDSQQKLDLSSPEVSRQVRNMIIEITALCNPRLRDHGNIVDLLAWGTSTRDWQEVPFLALELANNNLAAFLSNTRSVPLELRHCILLDIGCGLDAVHEIGLIHGDIKPENVLMFFKDGRWVAKLADFAGGADTGHDDTLEGRGTVGWRAPEFSQSLDGGSRLDPSLLGRIDSYSYGLMLWSMFLKDPGSVPCAESAEAETIALSELESHRTSLPMCLYCVLKVSLPELLKKTPQSRAKEVGHWLNDGSQVYFEWYESR